MTALPIAIIGRGCLLPGAASPAQLWEAILAGRDLLSGAPADRWGVPLEDVLCGPEGAPDRTWSDRGGYVTGFDEIFDPAGFALAPQRLAELDPLYRWLAHTAREALRDAGVGGRERVGAIFGNLAYPTASLVALSNAHWAARLLGDEERERLELVAPAPANRFVAGRPAALLATALGLEAGAFALDAACASSLYAIRLAADRLVRGDAEVMLAGAVCCADSLLIHQGFAALGALSRSGRSRPLHPDADGLVPAEGCAFLALKRLDAAVRDGNRIDAVIRAIALSNDGRSAGPLVPSQPGQQRAMRAAYAAAGMDPASIGLLECHATGTQVGDATELASTAAVFGAASRLVLGSVKANLGHAITVAGAAGAIAVLESLRSGELPPLRDAAAAREAVGRHGFRVLDRAEPWSGDGPRRAAISAFGFGGNNAHMIIEAHDPARAALGARARSRPPASAPAPPAPAAPSPGDPIAIVGIGVRAGELSDRAAFVDALLGDAPSGPSTAADVELPLAGLRSPPSDLRAALGQQTLVLACALEAVAEAGELPWERTGAFIGIETDPDAARYALRWHLATWARKLGAGEEWLAQARDGVTAPFDAASTLGAMPNMPANRLNRRLGAQGPTFTVSAGESSGLEALEIACEAVQNGDLDAALVGAVDLSVQELHEQAAAEVLPQGHEPAGDAAVVLVLRRLEDAKAAGDRIYALLPPPEEIGGDAGGDARAGVVDGATSAVDHPGPPDLAPKPLAATLSDRFGHSYAADGLLHLACGALCLHHRTLPSGTPWLPGGGPRTVHVTAADAGRRERRWSVAGLAAAPREPDRAGPRFHVFRGLDKHEVMARLDSGMEGGEGPACLVLVAGTSAQLGERVARARELLLRGAPAGSGVHFCARPPGGELAFVYTAAGAAYHRMGRGLLRALPELADALVAQGPHLSEVMRWVYTEDVEPSASELLWSTSALSLMHTAYTRELLALQPDALLGYSSGETTTLFAGGAWSGLARMYHEIEGSGLMDRELGGSFDALARRWGAPAQWRMWGVRAPVAQVRAALAGEERVHLAIVNTPGDCVIAGERDAVARVSAAIGPERCHELSYRFICHVPEVDEVAALWRRIHTRPVTSTPGLRYYSNADNAAYEPSVDGCAERLLRQAVTPIDFAATVERAYADGVRVFVEHGPSAGCTRWIGELLAERPHLVVALDRRGMGLEATLDATAALLAAAVPVDVSAVTGRLSPRGSAAVAGPTLRLPARWPPPRLPPRGARADAGGRASGERAPEPIGDEPQVLQAMPAAPLLAPALADQLVAPVADGRAARRPLRPATGGVAPPLARLFEQHSEVHERALAQLAGLHGRYLAAVRGAIAAAASPPSDAPPPAPDAAPPAPDAAPPAPDAAPPAPDAAPPAPDAAPPPSDAAPPAPDVASPAPDAAAPPAAPGPRGPTFDRAALETHARGRISDLFGPAFAPQDVHQRQVRMPGPPLLLADRVAGLDAVAGSMGTGTIWTETDVRDDAWYLHGGRMPAGLLIEAGQADLMLISYLGVDALNQGERVYRLLGCTVTFKGQLPRPGETLAYEIVADRHVSAGDIRLFWFRSDCTVAGEPRMLVRDGHAGFFTDEQLAGSQGVLWAAQDVHPCPDPRLEPPFALTERRSFTRAQLRAFAEGRAHECFGAGFEAAAAHVRSPHIQAGEQLIIDAVTELEPRGGPWGRGYLRAQAAVAADDWYFGGHFLNDPCMPGTLMLEGTLQCMAFYLAALGFTLSRDGWRFQPALDEPFELRCRGQVTPATRSLVCEVFVEELAGGPQPTLYADVLGSADGLAVFHGRRLALQLVPDWPLTTHPEPPAGRTRSRPAARAGGVTFDERAMLAAAWGRPSDAFGPSYARFDGHRRVARLPGPPYLFISRVVRVQGELGHCEAGAELECEYDIPPDAWYFAANGAPSMPLAVLMEAALQPCGWLACYAGCPLTVDEDLAFRNLDGSAMAHAEVTPRDRRLRTVARMTGLSHSAGMILTTFTVSSHVAERLVYEMDTVFGFFPLGALAQQVGLPADADDQLALTRSGDAPIPLSSGARLSDLRGRAELDTRADPTGDGRPRAADDGATDHDRGPIGGPRLATAPLLMLDRITGFWPQGGRHGLGAARAEKDVSPGDWYFKAHFHRDPVQPGSLGVEALVQLLQWFMLAAGLLAARPGVRLQPLAIGRRVTWRYRGQVLPAARLVTTTIELTEAGSDGDGPFAACDGSLWIDGRRIYEVTGLAIRAVG